MKRNGVVAVFCLGMALAAMGCGGAEGSSDVEALGNVSQGAICLDCEGGGGGGGDTGDGDPTPTSTGMDLAEYQHLASTSQSSGRCVGGISWEEPMWALDYAYSQQLITRAAYDWGRTYYWYPVIDRYNRIAAVCTFA